MPSHSLRRRALLAAPLVLPALRASGQGAWPRQVTDLLGRSVTLRARPRAVLIGEGFQLLNMALLLPDPVSVLVGMGGELKQVNPVSDAAYRQRFPALDKVPELTAAVGQGFSAERALALKPDLVILSTWQANSPEMRRGVELLESTGVPVVYMDIFQQPGRNTLPTIRLLGAVLGAEEKAEAYARFYEERRDRIVKRVAEAGKPGPRVLLSAFPGRWPCCWSPGAGGGDGEFMAMLGARNVAEGLTGNPRGGNIAVEQVLLSNAEVFIGTGLYAPGDTSAGIQVGPGAPPDAARASLERVLRMAEYSGLPAVRSRRALGIWNYFNALAANIVQLEAMARAVRPELFADLDPVATMAAINADFSAVPYEGAFWTSL
ncbi:ABC transporter substrate-binding protein [Roseomonas populi]|uniref:ABC transporter substrate-binding protein n=1 Tax=Roseomonas populi TaxID=3121582 RepID=A0ABT1X8Z0_9PROT|nr:ABC transporter substrate-binding protein [Roseomonas pecuniae]MCR0984174.1 ABC transporter substrate-binding protein [Roseomonas pecuniae]